MIADDIRKAETEAMVYFLLTAYIETAHSAGLVAGVPENITRLPVRGVIDVRGRFEALMLELDAASKRLDDRACVALKEALAVCSVALNRLQSLDGKGGWPSRLTAKRGPLQAANGVSLKGQEMPEAARPAPDFQDGLSPRPALGD